MIHVAIDPSLTGTAVAKGDATRQLTRHFPTVKPTESNPVDRIQRISSVVDDIVSWLAEDEIGVIFIEGYGFASKEGNWLSELGGVLRHELCSLSREFVEIPPTCLKRFTTGRGRAEKGEMESALINQFNKRFNSLDEVDAYALLRMGLVLIGVDTEAAEFQMAMVDGYRKYVSHIKTIYHG